MPTLSILSDCWNEHNVVDGQSHRVNRVDDVCQGLVNEFSPHEY